MEDVAAHVVASVVMWGRYGVAAGGVINSGNSVPVPLLTASGVPVPEGVRYGFTTRLGGVSPSPRGSLDLAMHAGADPEHFVENWRRAVLALDAGRSAQDVALLAQVHGADVVEVRRGAGPRTAVAQADGAWTITPGVVLAVRTADCVPVLLMCEDGVAVAHAGWRGTVAGVVPATVSALARGAGVSPSSLVAVVGPHISGASYEVGAEVVAELRAAGLADASFLRPAAGGRDHVDLGGAVRAQLEAAGVGRVYAFERCTFISDDMHSYRRDGVDAGRLAGLVVMRP